MEKYDTKFPKWLKYMYIHYGQDVTNQRQSRAGHAEQASVI